MKGSARSGVGHWALVAFAALLALVGIALAAGGLWLITLGGSWYYLFAGVGLLLSGILLWRAHMSGVWLYWAVFIGTLVWAVWEVGLDMWALMPRVLAPALLAVITLLFVPRLRRRRGKR